MCYDGLVHCRRDLFSVVEKRLEEITVARLDSILRTFLYTSFILLALRRLDHVSLEPLFYMEVLSVVEQEANFLPLV